MTHARTRGLWLLMTGLLARLGTLTAVFAVLVAVEAGAEPHVTAALQQFQTEPLKLVLGRSQVVNSSVPIRRASLANPAIADAVILSPTQLYVVAQTVGVTTLTLWDDENKVLTAFDLVVAPDLTRLKAQLHEVLPHETIMVTASHEHIALSGTVSSAVNLSRALSVAEAYAPENVLNLLEVGGVQQVMLDVRVAEMDRSLGRRLKVNFSLRSGNNEGIGAIDRLITPDLQGDRQIFRFSDAVNAFMSLQTGSLFWTAFLDALKEQGLVKILAEPSLMALSGQEASFLAGGEIPIPVPQGLGTVAIEFKAFGVGLTFKPTVLGSGKISMQVTPEVSELDFSRSVTIQGVEIPAFTTRRSSTVIELADGQSFTIAGLLQDNVRQTVARYPVLGDIPILGALFRSSEFQKNETELVIIVTPRLVKPVDAGSLRLPSHEYAEPNDFDFYLMGRFQTAVTRRKSGEGEPAGAPKGRPIKGMLDGEFGHLTPGGQP